MMTGMAAEPIPVETRGTIRLGQFLKLADAVDQGGDTKALLASRAVMVNDVVETRRGRQLAPGDVVVVGPSAYIVSVSEPAPQTPDTP